MTTKLAAVTETLELMVAVRPNFHHPALLAKQAANIDRIAGGRLALNVVSSWWAEEATSYGLQFDQHDDRYAAPSEHPPAQPTVTVWIWTGVTGLPSPVPFELSDPALATLSRVARPGAPIVPKTV